MDFLLLLSAVAFVFGTVNCDCNIAERDKCKIVIEAGLTAEDTCRKINDVRTCVIRDAGCTEQSANDAAKEVENDMDKKCSSDDWEKEGMCLTKKAVCEIAYNATVKDEKDQDKICQAIEDFHKCAETKCAVRTINERMTEFLREAKIDRCENIGGDMCTNLTKLTSCEMAFDNAKTDLELGTDEETLCLLANAVEHCFRTKAQCQSETTRRVVTRMLNKLDCSEYVDLCDPAKEELCAKQHPLPDNCVKLKAYRECLVLTGTCPAGRVHHVLRNMMKDKQFDCEDVDTCEAKKEEYCDLDVLQTEKTKEEKCELMKQYPKCLVRANCNEKYMKSRISFVYGQLEQPCGSSWLPDLETTSNAPMYQTTPCNPGTVNCDCNIAERDKCKIVEEAVVSAEDSCRQINKVRICVIRDAGCTEQSANEAATEMANDMDLKCSSDVKDWEKEGACISKETVCEDAYNATIKDQKDKEKICQAIDAFRTCVLPKCAVGTVQKRATMMIRRANIDKCENIQADMCVDFLKFSSCQGAFITAKADLGADDETLCMLANAVEHCFRTKAKCQPETTKRAIENLLNKLDCSEYVDLCDHRKEEICDTRHPLPDNCEKLKAYRECLVFNGTCPAGRVHHLLRNMMKDKQFDCEDADTCVAKKEESCDMDVTKPMKTKEEKCDLFKQFPKCLVRANCNEKYMNSRIALMNDKLEHPCGASSMLASIGLTLLLAAITAQWN